MRAFAITVAVMLFAATAALAQTAPVNVGASQQSNTQSTAPAPTAAAGTAASPYGTTQAPGGYTTGVQVTTPMLGSSATPPAALNIQFPPAVITANDGVTAPIFGADLFTGAFAGSTTTGQADYTIQPGDIIELKTYGALSLDLVGRVNADGTLFIPVVGPVKLAGVSRGSLNSQLQAQLSSIYTNIRVYADIVQPGAIGVYVTGNVSRPGRYLGLTDDTVLYFLDKAGGIDGQRGSFREIYVRHRNGTQDTVDLYKFRIAGEMKPMRFADGDSIVVPSRGPTVVVTGLVKNPFAFELSTPATRAGQPPDQSRDGVADAGSQIMAFAIPDRTVTSVSIHSFKGREPIAAYRDIATFGTAWLGDGDHVEFRSDTMASMISVTIQADLASPSVYVVPKDAKLSEVLAGISIDNSLADPLAVHVLRKSVAVRQKQALNDSLLQLQKQAYTSQAVTPEQATAQVAAAPLIDKFVQIASQAQPTGLVAVYRNGVFQDIHLEEGDQIVIPNKTDVVIVSGEVLVPGALAHRKGATIGDYVKDTGGYTTAANTDDFVIRSLDGSARMASESTVPKPGDVIMVVPEVSGYTFQLVKDISTLIFQLALSTATVMKL